MRICGGKGSTVRFVFHRAENIVRKVEYALPCSTLYPIMFPKGLFVRGLESRHCMVKS